MRHAMSAACLLLASCTGVSAPSGLAEPVRVRNATFIAGDLPGTPPPADDPGTPLEGTQITDLENNSGVLTERQAGKAFSGRTTPSAYSVGMRFQGLGTGYWVVPAGAPDPANNGELGFSMTADFGADIPPGLQTLRFVAIDANGVGGVQRDLSVCVLPEVPDNLNACDPHLEPPAAVISLSWDTDVDLDLEVRTPDGRIVNWAHPSTATRDGTGTVDRNELASPHTGALDRNSNANCAIDSIRRENLVWPESPASGTYLVYANLFSACGQPSVRFRAALYQRQTDPTGDTYHVVETASRDGVLLAQDANGGAAQGLYVLDVTFP